MIDRLELSKRLLAVLLIYTLGILPAMADAGRKTSRDSAGEMLETMGTIANDDDSADTRLCEKICYSKLADQWIKEYMSGRPGASDATWAKMMKEMKGTRSIYMLVFRLHYRLSFDASKNATKCNVVPYCTNLISATEKCLGKDHLYLDDILSFEANYYEARHDFRAALQPRLRQMVVNKKAFGEVDDDFIRSALDTTFVYCKIGQLDQAETLCKKVVSICDHHKMYALPGAVKLELQILTACKKLSEARALSIKYKKILCD